MPTLTNPAPVVASPPALLSPRAKAIAERLRRKAERVGADLFLDKLLAEIWRVPYGQWVLTALSWQPLPVLSEHARDGWRRAQWAVRKRLARVDLATLRGTHEQVAQRELNLFLRHSVRISVGKWAAAGRVTAPESSHSRKGGRTSTLQNEPKFLQRARAAAAAKRAWKALQSTKETDLTEVDSTQLTCA